jgi:hypothetical protein
MHFVAIGDRRINLDTVTHVEFAQERQVRGSAESAGPRLVATIVFVGPEEHTLYGQDAEALRRQIDGTIGNNRP